MSEHVVLLTVLLVTFVVAVGGFVILGWMLRDSQKMVREAQNLTRAVGMLVIQETNKLPGKTG